MRSNKIMKKIITKALHISAAVISLAPLFAQSDDTEIYLGNSNDKSRSLANIVFIMDTSGSMGNNVDGKTRLKTVQEVANAVISESAADPDKDFNIALMSFNGNHGAVVDMPMTRLDSATTNFKSIMNAYTAGGNTPITESLHEALLYLKGETPLYGSSSVSASKENGKYKSPITDECQTNHIVLFSDGQPTWDGESNNYISQAFNTLTHERKNTFLTDTAVQKCNEPNESHFYPNGFRPNSFTQDGITYTYNNRREWSSYYSRYRYYYNHTGDHGSCAEELAVLAQTTDLAPGVDFPGLQNAIIHTVGGFAGNDALTKLRNIAKYGTPLNDDGTEQLKTLGSETVPKNYYEASNASELKNQLTALFGDIIKNDSTFTAPAVSVNAYNKLQHNDELYYSVFSPEKNANWKGNLKRYRIEGDVIYDNSSPTPLNAVDPATGFFDKDSHSFWTLGTADGKAVDKGGIASRLRLPSELALKDGRMVTTYLIGNDTNLTDASNRIHPDNNNLINSMFSAQNNGERKNIIKWASGIDVNNEDEGTVNGSSTAEFEDARPFMEDPLHSQPVIINYSADERVVFISTNSGYLHAFSPKLDSAPNTTPVERPKELFSFIPRELLTNIKPYYSGETGKKYGLDGPLSYYHHDLNQNGFLFDSNNRVEEKQYGGTKVKEYIHVYASMRRGGRNYYALDVTNPVEPKYLWQITGGTGKFKKLGQTWSKMIPAKVKWDGQAKNVLFFGGGYDRDKEDCLGTVASLNCSDGPVRRTDVTMGNAIFMVDALTGQYLWSASNDSSSELTLPEMTSSIVSDLNIIDTDQDGLADLIYSSDTGGRLWRIDLDNNPPASSGDDMIAYGGPIADMNVASNNIQFYNTVDVAYINDEKSSALPHFQLSIGSGYRAHPLNTITNNRFYIVNDYNVTDKPTTANLSTFYQKITESDLVDTAVNGPLVSTSKPKGIFHKLQYAGEKVLARSTTAGNKIFFTTYRPNTGIASTSCAPNVGYAYFYTLTPKYGDGVTKNDTVSVVSEKLEQTGIPPRPIVIFPPTPDPGNNPTTPPDVNAPKASCAGVPIIIVGAEIKDSGIDCNSRMQKTYWKMN